MHLFIRVFPLHPFRLPLLILFLIVYRHSTREHWKFSSNYYYQQLLFLLLLGVLEHILEVPIGSFNYIHSLALSFVSFVLSLGIYFLFCCFLIFVFDFKFYLKKKKQTQIFHSSSPRFSLLNQCVFYSSSVAFHFVVDEFYIKD